MAGSTTRRAVLLGAAASAAAFNAGKAVASEPITHLIRITNFAFLPERLEVRVGDRIEWINYDLAPHTATAESFGWDTGEIVKNQTSEAIQVTADMEKSYFCVFHPHMKGEIALI